MGDMSPCPSRDKGTNPFRDVPFVPRTLRDRLKLGNRGQANG